MARKTTKLKCPYSGVEMADVFEPDLRGPGWMVVGGFDPSLPFFSREDGVAAFRRRDGVDGAVPKPACAYSGTAVKFVEQNGLWYATGWDFNPYSVMKRREEIIFLSRRRNGRSYGRPPAPVGRVQAVKVREQVSNPAEGLGGSGEDELVEELLK